jgi:hypothetical protein
LVKCNVPPSINCRLGDAKWTVVARGKVARSPCAMNPEAHEVTFRFF